MKIQFVEYDGFNNIKITMIGKVTGSPYNIIKITMIGKVARSSYNIFLLRLLHGMSRAVMTTSTSQPIRMLALA
jgi:hypothetical protein